jgi:hypothetical protein
MLGRASEEGFEFSHKGLEQIRKPLMSMTATRVSTIFKDCVEIQFSVESKVIAVEQPIACNKHNRYIMQLFHRKRQ